MSIAYLPTLFFLKKSYYYDQCILKAVVPYNHQPGLWTSLQCRTIPHATLAVILTTTSTRNVFFAADMVISTNKPTINKSQWLCFLAVLKHVDRLRVIPFIWTVSERVWNFKLCISLWHYHSIGIGIMMKQIIIGLDPSPFKPCLVPMGYTNISWTETVRLCGTPCGFNSSSNTADTSAALGKIYGKTPALCRSIKRFGFFWMSDYGLY